MSSGEIVGVERSPALKKRMFKEDMRPLTILAGFFLLTLLFGLAYAQAPLYTSNQNQYLLRGAALSGMGDLDADWLVGTRDSTPVFSFLARVVFQFLHPWVFYVVYGILLGLYLFALIAGVQTLFSFEPRQLLLAGGVLFVIHSAGFRFVMGRIPGEHWEYLLEAGFAGQRLLGPVLQPSSFGVFLIVSVLLYLRRKPYAAVLAAVFAATVHPTYLLSAASLTLSYMIGLFLEDRSIRKPLMVGLAALAAVLPVLLYVLGSFVPTSTGMTREAQNLLVEFRIPQHTRIRLWFDATVVIKLIMMAVALLLSRRTRLYPVILIPGLVMLLLTGAQVLLDSNQLAVLFPWRLSTWLLPLSMAYLCGAVIQKLTGMYSGFLTGSWIPAVVLSMAVLLAGVGGVKFYIESQRKEAEPAKSMMEYVREHADGEQVYMIPPKLQVFRLETGEPVMVDFKSIPYQDREVLEWYDRVRLAQFFYRDKLEYIDCGLLVEASDLYGVTHVVLGERQLDVDCPGLVELYRDQAYGVYRLGH